MRKNPKLVHVAIAENSGQPLAFDTNLDDLKDLCNDAGGEFRIDTYVLKRTSYTSKRWKRA
jgi:hypothetical protein